jgi:hypothetical protein
VLTACCVTMLYPLTGFCVDGEDASREPLGFYDGRGLDVDSLGGGLACNTAILAGDGVEAIGEMDADVRDCLVKGWYRRAQAAIYAVW